MFFLAQPQPFFNLMQCVTRSTTQQLQPIQSVVWVKYNVVYLMFTQLKASVQVMGIVMKYWYRYNFQGT